MSVGCVGEEMFYGMMKQMQRHEYEGADKREKRPQVKALK